MTTNIQTITIKPGECVYLPKDVELLSITNSGGLDINSDCLDFNVPAPVCASFHFSLDDADVNFYDPTDGARIDSVIISGVSFPIDFLMSPSASILVFPPPGFMNVAGITNSFLTSTANNSSRQYVISLRMPSGYVDKIELKLTFITGKWPNGLYVKPQIDACP